MMIDWSPLDKAMEGRAPVFWWRDDDAVAPTPALDRLIAMAGDIDAPLLLASIPLAATSALAARIEMTPKVDIAVHGWSHVSHAAPGEKNAEFGAHRPLARRVWEAEQGLTRLNDLFGNCTLPVFIPPWNRMGEDMPAALATVGFNGVSVYGQRIPSNAPIPRVDAHLDPIDWRGTRSVVDPAIFIAKVVDLLEDDLPIGLMTHHLVHDEAIWEFVAALVTRLTKRGARWTSFASLIAPLEAPTVR